MPDLVATLATGFPAGTPSARSTDGGEHIAAAMTERQNEPWEFGVSKSVTNANREALKAAAVNLYDRIWSISNFLNDNHHTPFEC